MELSQHGFLEELLSSTPWSSSFSNGFNDFFQNAWNFTSFDDENPQIAANSNNFPHFPAIQTPSDFSFADQHLYTNFLEGFAMPDLDSSSYTKNNETPPFVSQEENSAYPPLPPPEGELCFMDSEAAAAVATSSVCKVEMEQMGGREINGSKMGLGELGRRSNKAKKIEGQPSKNLMAERRRRKRLNDRLSMLRAIVPKISKMDRTSILGDTIDYVKELLERINNLKEEEEKVGLDSNQNHVSLNGISKEGKSNEVLVRNSPKFDVERRERVTRIDICCATRPGLLLSTVNTLEALGLEIQQCVISCFNDFSMQASCSEGTAQKAVASSDDIKEALFRNAGYGGKCL